MGAWISCSEKDFEIRKALAWTVMHRMKRLWTSNMSNQLKIRAFKATVETVLLIGSQCWTVDSKLRKHLNGCYTRLLRMAQNISWKSKTINEKLYNGLPKVTDIISERMLNLAGHCVRHKEDMAHNLVLWTPTRGKRRRGRQQLTFVDALKLQTDLESIDEIRSVMMDRGKWKKLSKLGRVRARRKLVSMRSNTNSINTTKLNSARRKLQETYIAEQSQYLQKQIEDITMAAGNKKSALAWHIVNKISGRKSTYRSKIKAIDQTERLQKWKNHFSSLLGENPIIKHQITVKIVNKELAIEQGPFTLEELEKVLAKTKLNKSAGINEIPPKVWKYGYFNDQLLEFDNDVFSQKPIEYWIRECILPFPKKGDLSLTDNYRGITFTCIAAKIYNTMIRERIQPAIDEILRPNQNGFRKNRSTVGQILTVRRIIEGIKEKNPVACIIFIDFSKAFDSIHRPKMAEILKSYGIPNKIINAIMILYSNNKSLVRSPDGDTELFKINSGVLQGDTLAPLLFIITLDYVLRTSIDLHKDLGLTLQKSKEEDTQLLQYQTQCLHVLEEKANSVGLRVNIRKTQNFNINTDHKVRSVNGTQLKSVDNYTYLGSEISSMDKDIKIRIAKSWSALDKLSSIWKSNLTATLKRNVFRAVVDSVLLYGSEAWTLTKKLERKLDGTYTRMLRVVFNISWKLHLTNKKLYGNIPTLSKTIRERRTRFAGHCFRRKNEIISGVLMWMPAHGFTKRGRPKRNYIKQLTDDTGLTVEEAKTAMKDRNIWKKIVEYARETIPIW